jgi:SWI/SNF-related matrix-associated actin-dependent regulator of chromatin subfamily A-like protein 1
VRLPSHLYSFQAEDAQALLTKHNRLLMEPMGAGKSVIAIAAAEALDAYTVVVICPAILRADWVNKFLQFGQQSYAFNADNAGRRVIVVSYEQVNTPERRSRLLQHVQSIDVLILDEGQRLKSIDAHVVQSVYGHNADGTGLVALARHVWVVSGTLCPNNWSELYTHIRACFPERLPVLQGHPMSYQNFLDHFCEWQPTRWGFKVTGNRNQAELRDLLKNVSIYRSREEIYALLPRLLTTTVELPQDMIEAQGYAEFIESEEGIALQQAMPELQSGVAWPDSDMTLAKARHELGKLKAAAVASYVRELLEEDVEARVLVFAHHHAVLHRIAADLCDIDPVCVIEGTTPQQTRNDYIERYQKGGMRVLVLGIGTAREGITLTAANRVIFAEASWTPAYNAQAIHRAYRIGQTRPVLAEYLCIADTLDEAVMRTCARKSELLSEVL